MTDDGATEIDPSTDLSITDIKFLEAVRDINANPGEYGGIEDGEVPASITAITEATDLTKPQIEYRITPGDHKRGFEVNGGAGLIRIHSAQLVGNRFGPKSAEITEKGEKALAEAKRAHGLTDDGEPDATELATLQKRLEDLDQQVTDLQETVEKIEAIFSRFDAEVDEVFEGDITAADALSAAVLGMPRHNTVIEALLGVDAREVDEMTDEAIRAQVRDTLGSDAGSR